MAAGLSIEPGTYNWGAKYLFVDVLGDYRLTKRLWFYFNLRNATDSPEDFKIFGPSTPAVARFNYRIDYASLWTCGISGSFCRESADAGHPTSGRDCANRLLHR